MTRKYEKNMSANQSCPPFGCPQIGPSTVSYWKNSITVYWYLDWIIILISMIYVGNWCQKCILIFNSNAHVHWIEKDSLWSKLAKKEDIWSFWVLTTMHNFKRNIIFLFIYWFNIQKFSINSWTYCTEFNVYSLFRASLYLAEWVVEEDYINYQKFLTVNFGR